jgi:hypothetical protein
MSMAKTYKIPKKIAAVRVPRPIRKSKILRGFLQSPQNRLLAASMVVAAGGAMTAVLARHRPSAEQVNDAGQNAAGLGRLAVGAVAELVNRVIHSLAASLTPSHEVRTDDPPTRPDTAQNVVPEDTAGHS